MITIEIPECQALKSAEDELVEYILNQLNANGVAYFKYYTADCKEAKTGDWAESTGDWFSYCNEIRHKSSSDAIFNVINAFRKKGYLVKDMFTYAHFNEVTILK